MCVTSNCDLEVIQGRQSAVERILLYAYDATFNRHWTLLSHITPRAGVAGCVASRVRRGAGGRRTGVKLKGTDRICKID